MTDYKKLVNNTFTDGIIKMNEADPAHELDALSTGLQQLRQTMINNYEPNKMKSQNEFNAICLLQLDNILTEDAELIRVKARIPEVHSLLPIPDHKDDYNKISLYPTFIGIVGDLSVSPTSQAIPVGTELSVTFDNTTNFGGPKIVRVLKMSPVDTSPDESTIPGEKLGRLKIEDTPTEMVKIENTDKLKLRSKTRYGTKHMKQYLYSFPASWGIIKPGDVSDAAGSRRNDYRKDGWPKDPATPTFGGPLPPHKSHQSGIDVDLPLFLKGSNVHTYPKGTIFHKEAKKLVDAKKKVDPNVILKKLDVQRTFDFLAHTVEYAKMIILHPAIVKHLIDHKSSITGHSEEIKTQVLRFVEIWRDRAGKSGIGQGDRAHSDHFHVRLKSRGYDDPAGNGKIWANYKKSTGYSDEKPKSWTQEGWICKGYTPLWSKQGVGPGAKYIPYSPPDKPVNCGGSS